MVTTFPYNMHVLILIDWLNELLKVPDFFGILYAKKSEKSKINFSRSITDLVGKTKDYRNKKIKDLNNDEQNTIKRLNRLLFEETYPRKTPKRNYFENNVIVSHTHFDRISINRAAEKYGKFFDVPIWLDTATVVRRAWPNKYASRGYGLANVAKDLGIEFLHHNAKEDARAAGEITRKGNPDGPLAGEVVVFTGALSITRREAADLAAQAGCEVAPSVTQSTTLLIVGDTDIHKLAGHEKSIKQRKAERLIANGQSIRIIGESDFTRLVKF